MASLSPPHSPLTSSFNDTSSQTPPLSPDLLRVKRKTESEASSVISSPSLEKRSRGPAGFLRQPLLHPTSLAVRTSSSVASLLPSHSQPQHTGSQSPSNRMPVPYQLAPAARVIPPAPIGFFSSEDEDPLSPARRPTPLALNRFLPSEEEEKNKSTSSPSSFQLHSSFITASSLTSLESELLSTRPSTSSSSGLGLDDTTFQISTPLDFRNRSSLSFASFTAQEQRRERRDQQRTQTTPFIPIHAPRRDVSGLLHRPFTYLGRETLERKHPFLRKAVEIQQQEELSFDWKGAKIYVDLDESIMTGQHSIVGRIAGGQPKIFEHLENDELIFKTFRDHCIMLVDGGEKIGNNAAATIIQEYEAVKRALNRSRFGVADLHNIKQVAEDCGYFLFEYVPHSLIDPLSSVEGNKRLSRQELNVMRDIERLTSHIWNEDDSEPPMNQHDRLLLQTLRKLSPYIALKGAPLIELSSEEKKLLITFRRLAPALWPATKTPLATASEEQRNTLLATHRIAPYIWEKREGTLIRDLAPLQQRLLTDLCELFQCTYFSGTTPDLRPDNLRYRADGTLTLIDFRENPVDTDDRDIFYDEMIASFNCSKGDQIYNTIKGSMMTGISGNVSSSSFSQ